MAGDTFEVILEVTLFVAGVWLGGRLFRQLKLSPILGEIIVGVALGPHVLNLVPYTHTEDEEHEAEIAGVSLTEPGVFVLAGQLGVTLLIMESGMHMHLDRLRTVGAKAAVVAMLGTFLPVAAGVLIMMALGEDPWPDGLAAGVALAPTSVGIALKLLNEAKQISSPYGQTIVTAAFIDDVLSLILLVILLNLAEGSVTFFSIGVPVIAAAAFVVLGTWLGTWAMPRILNYLSRFTPENPLKSLQPRDELHLGLMMALLVAYGWVGSVIGSHLLGAFVAGISFTTVPRSMFVWHRQIKRIASWLLRMFFAASVAFAIPVETMLSIGAVWKGIVVAIVACIGAKVICGVFTKRDKWLVGVAMVGRGEFAYLVAETSTTTLVENKSSPGNPRYLLNDEAFSIVVWALLWSTIVAPLAFKYVLQYRLKHTLIRRSSSIGRRDKRGTFKIKMEGLHHTGLLVEVCNVLHSLSLDVVEASVESDGFVDSDLFTVRLRDGADLDDEKVEELRHSVLEALADPDGKVVFLPPDHGNHPVLKLSLMMDHDEATLSALTAFLAALGLDVTMCSVRELGSTDCDEFYARIASNHSAAIGPMIVGQVKAKIVELFREFHVHGEAMVKTVAAEPVQNELPDVPLLYGEAASCRHMLRINVQGMHRPEVLHEVTDELHKHHLDVVHGYIQSPGGDLPDNAVFICKAPSETDITRKYRSGVQMDLLKVFKQHDCEGAVAVGVYDTTLGGGMQPSEAKETKEQAPSSPTRGGTPPLSGIPFASPGAMLRTCMRGANSPDSELVTTEGGLGTFKLVGTPGSGGRPVPAGESPLHLGLPASAVVTSPDAKPDPAPTDSPKVYVLSGKTPAGELVLPAPFRRSVAPVMEEGEGVDGAGDAAEELPEEDNTIQMPRRAISQSELDIQVQETDSATHIITSARRGRPKPKTAAKRVSGILKELSLKTEEPAAGTVLASLSGRSMSSTTNVVANPMDAGGVAPPGRRFLPVQVEVADEEEEE